MGFSSSLQGDSAHEALITRQDAELRLLENMKRCPQDLLVETHTKLALFKHFLNTRISYSPHHRCITLRVKCDREYSIALNSVVLQV